MDLDSARFERRVIPQEPFCTCRGKHEKDCLQYICRVRRVVVVCLIVTLLYELQEIPQRVQIEIERLDKLPTAEAVPAQNRQLSSSCELS